MSFLHQIFYGNNKFDITEETIADLNKWAEYIAKKSGREAEGVRGNSGERSSKEFHVDKTICRDTDPHELCSLEFTRDTKGTCVTSRSECFTNSDEVGLKDVVTEIITPVKKYDAVKYSGREAEGVRGNSRERSSLEFTSLSKPIVKHSSLFWCVFLAHYGYSEYLRVGTRFQNRELEEKQTMMETLSKNAKQMKDGNMRITNDAVQEILSGLMVSSKDALSALVAYSKYYKKTIYVVFSSSYLVFSYAKEYLSHDISDICVIYQTRTHPKYGGSYSLEFDVTLEKLQSIQETKIAMEHYEKPFRGISAYKIADLTAMATKIGILEAMKKTDLYTAIVEKCCEGIQRE
jgi:hypothetical protein